MFPCGGPAPSPPSHERTIQRVREWQRVQSLQPVRQTFPPSSHKTTRSCASCRAPSWSSVFFNTHKQNTVPSTVHTTPPPLCFLLSNFKVERGGGKRPLGWLQGSFNFPPSLQMSTPSHPTPSKLPTPNPPLSPSPATTPIAATHNPPFSSPLLSNPLSPFFWCSHCFSR